MFFLWAFSAEAETLSGHVVGVTDGDTITVLDSSSTQHKIRLSGIDCPEKKQPYGQQAKLKMGDLVFDKDVTVEWNKLDRYGRTIGLVRVSGKDAGLELVKSGLAWHYKKYQSEQSPADRERYSDAEVSARTSHNGLWQDPTPTPPWEWRHQ